MPSTTENLKELFDGDDRPAVVSASLARAILAELEALLAVAEKAQRVRSLVAIEANVSHFTQGFHPTRTPQDDFLEEFDAALAHLKTVTEPA
jgi:hypothetical protein